MQHGERVRRSCRSALGKECATEQSHTHGWATDSDNPLRMMIDHLPTLAWSCRPDGTTAFLNQRWLDYTGLSMAQALDWGWQVAIHPEDLGKLMDTWGRLLASGEPGEEAARLRRCDGAYRWFLLRAVPVRDAQGKVVSWYGTNTDIEDLKRAELLLAAEKRTLEMIDGGASLTDIFDNLCNTIDAQVPNVMTTVLLVAHRYFCDLPMQEPDLPPLFQTISKAESPLSFLGDEVPTEARADKSYSRNLIRC